MTQKPPQPPNQSLPATTRTPAAQASQVAAERRLRAFELRKTGMTYAQIAQHMGVSEPHGYRLVKQRLKQIEDKTAELVPEVRRMEVERLDRLLMGLWAKATGGDVFAVDRVLRIMERRAKYLGLDVPTEQNNRQLDAEGNVVNPSGNVIIVAPDEPQSVDAWAEQYAPAPLPQT